jgi:zinc protease
MNRLPSRPSWLVSCAAALIASLLAAGRLTLPSVAQTASPARQDALAELQEDPALKHGMLANGMTFSIMPNAQPPGAASIRLLIRAGSLNEYDTERGFFHFIEHMAFNGSRAVPEGEMVRSLARLGLEFGPDANAETGQDYTVFSLNLPNASPDTLEECLFLLRQIASELSFDPSAVERERGVVLAEARRSDTFERRRRELYLSFLAPGAYATGRMPIGDHASISAATPESLRSLYDRFYRPERSTLIVVGDMDPDLVENRIAANFSDWEGRGEKGVDPDLPYTPRPRHPEASLFFHPDGGDTLGVYYVSPYRKIPDSIAGRRERILLAIGVSALNRRLSAMTSSAEAPFRGAHVFATDIVKAVNLAGGAVSVSPGRWRPGLIALEQAWRSALEHGFTREEIKRELAALQAIHSGAHQSESTRSTPALAASLAQALQDGETFSSPGYLLRLFETWAPGVTAEEVQSVFRTWLERGQPLFFMSTSIELPSAGRDIPAAWAESEREPVEPTAARRVDAFAYADFGTPGRIADDRQLPWLDARAIVFDNNVRLTIKKTPYEAGAVRLSVRVGEGAIALEGAPSGLVNLMTAYSAGGLERHSADDIETMFADRAVQARFSAFPDFFGGVYLTRPEDLTLQLQLAAAYLLHPGYRSEAERKWREAVVQSWPRLDADARSVFASQGARRIMSGDRRFGTDPGDGAAFRSFAELRAYLTPILENAPIEIAIVGDVEEPVAIAAVATTFGALPRRRAVSDALLKPRPVTFAPPHSPIVLTHRGELTQALLKMYWPVTVDADADPQAVRVLQLLGSIVHTRLIDTVRERLGATYAPSAGFSSSTVYPALNYLYAEVEARPSDIPHLKSALDELLSDVRGGGIDADELERARAPALEQIAAHASSNIYWLSVLSQAQSKPGRTERVILDAVEGGIRAVTLQDLQAASKWLDDANVREIDILPAPQPPEE